MKLFLYSVVDGDNVINKNLGVGLEIDIKLRNDVDLSKPTIMLRNIDGVNFDNFNYAFIDVLGRYYFIDRLGKVSKNDNVLYLNCDVLETYKSSILASVARLKRNIKSGDYYDGSIDKTVNTSILKYNSNVVLSGEINNVVTTVGAN